MNTKRFEQIRANALKAEAMTFAVDREDNKVVVTAPEPSLLDPDVLRRERLELLDEVSRLKENFRVAQDSINDLVNHHIRTMPKDAADPLRDLQREVNGLS